VTGDCHAGIRGSPEVRFLRATRPPDPDAIALADVVLGSLDELTPEVLETISP
jgi:hypothetical protein